MRTLIGRLGEKLRFLRHFSLAYFTLRSITSGGAVVGGLIQTFVLIRLLSPELFSIYILVAALGVSLWLLDFGMAKILFIRMRDAHLHRRHDPDTPTQCTAVVLLYFLLVVAGAVACAMFMAYRPGISQADAINIGLFFSFSAFNLVWFALRNISLAIDEFIFFETLEAVRRVGHIGVMLALLIHLPLVAFLLLANLLWLILFAISIVHLLKRGALRGRLRGTLAAFLELVRRNRRAMFDNSVFASSELYVHNFPYFVVPAVFGLGAPTIVFDTVYKIFRGAALVYAVGCDIAVPGQTRAIAKRDAGMLWHVTLAALALCFVPMTILSALLYWQGDWIFRLLLGSVVTMPRDMIPILIVLLGAILVKNICTSLMQHTGFFKENASVAALTTAAMTALAAIALLGDMSFLQFMIGYTALYVASAVLYVAFSLRGPFRTASSGQTKRVHSPAPTASAGERP